MHDVFKKVQGLLHIDAIIIDNIIFRFHYRVTMVVLITFSLLITSRQYFGDPIDCIVDGIDSKLIDVYCWIHATFTMPLFSGAVKGEVVPHPGVANHFLTDQYTKELQESQEGDALMKAPVRHHKYYQWVALFLFLQAILFYLPRYIWKSWEAGRLRMLVDRLNQPIVDAELKRLRMNTIIGYFTSNLHRHNVYAYQFFICEVFNFINVIGQIYFTDRFLDFGFLTFGSRVYEHENARNSRHDPMEDIFPKVTKCSFHRFGPSGSIVRHDALCVLPLNILNQKIFAFLWFWFIIVAVITGIGLLYRMATFSASFRHLLLRGRSRLASAEEVKRVCQEFMIGDWFLVYLMAKNMDPFVFKDFISALAPKITNKVHQS
ncbi:innexin inx2-like [Macrobrachium rosenbergii]|uniref:innexin inx2-like n=1 Tax=Macrobrachium rosenbergii TaxID=79674 RepID=UPI0034D4FDA4